MRFLAFVLLAAVGAGCCLISSSGPVAPELFAVVPGADGHVGAIVVRRASAERLIDSAYGTQRILADGSVVAGKTDANEVREMFGATLAALPGRPASFTLYFFEGKDELTGESKVELERVFAELKRRPLPDIMVIGHTDTVGSLPYNDRLSLARAERMREMMIELGIPAARIEAAGRGKRELLVPTEDNVSEPRNRRVEISVR